jgi:hypothetical protein
VRSMPPETAIVKRMQAKNTIFSYEVKLLLAF